MIARGIEYSLWLEFEEYADGYPGPDVDPQCDFCNAKVTVGSRAYALNIWTFVFLEVARRTDPARVPLAEPARYVLAPDLFVERLDRTTISHAIGDLLAAGGLPEAWRLQEP